MSIGLGEIGGKALEILARRPGMGRIIAADFNVEYGKQKVNNALFGVAMEGYYSNIIFTPGFYYALVPGGSLKKHFNS